MKDFLKIARPRISKAASKHLLAGYAASNRLHNTYKYQCGYNNVSYFETKLPGFKCLRYDVNTHALDFSYKGVVVKGESAENIRDGIRATGRRRGKQYKKLLPVVVPKVPSNRLQVLRRKMVADYETHLMRSLSTCASILDKVNIIFTKINYHTFHVDFIIKGKEYKDMNMFKLRELVDEL